MSTSHYSAELPSADHRGDISALRGLGDLLGFYRAFFSSDIAFTMAAVCLLIGSAVHWLPIVAGLAALQYAYAVDNLLDRAWAEPGTGPRWTLHAIILCTLAIMLTLAFIQPALLLITLLMLVLFSVYNAEFKHCSLKKIPYLKSPYISFFLCIFTVGLPAFYVGQVFSPTTGLLFLCLFCTTTARSLTRDSGAHARDDSRDDPGDNDDDDDTIKVTRGPARTRLAAFVLLLGALTLSGTLHVTGLVVYVAIVGALVACTPVSRHARAALNLASGPLLYALIAMVP